MVALREGTPQGHTNAAVASMAAPAKSLSPIKPPPPLHRWVRGEECGAPHHSPPPFPPPQPLFNILKKLK